ncbi:MAG: hypothetical protein ACUVWB_03350 [Anaerolineae bacterium]
MGKNPCYIFTGRFGSGKTEIAINFALKLCRQPAGEEGGCPVLVDLDVVTPYFRSRELADKMRERGLEVVTPAAVSRYLDTPGLTPEIMGVLEDGRRTVVLDVGGDVQGARVLAQYRDVLRERGYIMYVVVNPYRPFTRDDVGIAAAVRDMELTTRLSAGGLVGNPHMLASTTPEQFLEGWEVLVRASRRLGIPLAMVAVEQSLLPAVVGHLPADTPLLPLERFFFPPWEEEKPAGR